MSDTDANSLSFAVLKAKHRDIRDGFPESLSLRVHRALSWLQRAEHEEDDRDAAFIFLWIAFNAAYADELHDGLLENERSAFADYFGKLTKLDADGRIYAVIWDQFPQAIRVLLTNQYIFQPFWKHHNGTPGHADWEKRFKSSKRTVGEALNNQDTETILSVLFDRLYVPRNQIIHGGATWNSAVNRDQLRDGAAILSFLVPLFVDTMMDHPEEDWGSPFYPVIN